MLPSFSTETNSLATNSIPKSDTIQNIAIKIIEEQIRLLKLENGPKERTIFFFGSKGAVSCILINEEKYEKLSISRGKPPPSISFLTEMSRPVQL